MIRSCISMVLLLAIVGTARAETGRVHIVATGLVAASEWRPQPGGPDLGEFLRREALRRAMANARAQAEGVASANRGAVTMPLSVTIRPDAPPARPSLTNSVEDENRIRVIRLDDEEYSRGVSEFGAQITIEVLFNVEYPDPEPLAQIQVVPAPRL